MLAARERWAGETGADLPTKRAGFSTVNARGGPAERRSEHRAPAEIRAGLLPQSFLNTRRQVKGALLRRDAALALAECQSEGRTSFARVISGSLWFPCSPSP